MGYRETEISNHAAHIINAYLAREGYRLFSRLKNLADKETSFQEQAPSYFQWLLFVVPEGYRADVNRKIQDMRPDLKLKISNLMQDPETFIRETVPEVDSLGPTLFANPDEEIRKEIEQEVLLTEAKEHEFELLTGRKPDEAILKIAEGRKKAPG